MHTGTGPGGAGVVHRETVKLILREENPLTAERNGTKGKKLECCRQGWASPQGSFLTWLAWFSEHSLGDIKRKQAIEE